MYMYVLYIFCVHILPRIFTRDLPFSSFSFFFLWVKNVLEYIIFMCECVWVFCMWVGSHFPHFPISQTTTKSTKKKKKTSQKMKEKQSKRKVEFQQCDKTQKASSFSQIIGTQYIKMIYNIFSRRSSSSSKKSKKKENAKQENKNPKKHRKCSQAQKWDLFCFLFFIFWQKAKVFLFFFYIIYILFFNLNIYHTFCWYT